MLPLDRDDTPLNHDNEPLNREDEPFNKTDLEHKQHCYSVIYSCNRLIKTVEKCNSPDPLFKKMTTSVEVFRDSFMNEIAVDEPRDDKYSGKIFYKEYQLQFLKKFSSMDGAWMTPLRFIFWIIHVTAKREVGFVAAPLIVYAIFSPAMGASIIISSLIATTIAGYFKILLRVPRPTWIDSDKDFGAMEFMNSHVAEGTYATPSAHVVIFTSTAAYVFIDEPNALNGIIFVIMFLLSSFGRMYFRVHYPQCCVLGAIIGSLVPLILISIGIENVIIRTAMGESYKEVMVAFIVLFVVNAIIISALSLLNKPSGEVQQWWMSNSGMISSAKNIKFSPWSHRKNFYAISYLTGVFLGLIASYLHPLVGNDIIGHLFQEIIFQVIVMMGFLSLIRFTKTWKREINRIIIYAAMGFGTFWLLPLIADTLITQSFNNCPADVTPSPTFS